MEVKPIRVLLVEDNPGDFRLIQEMFKESKANIELKWARQLSTGLTNLKEEMFDVLLADLGLPDSQGIDTFKTIHEQAPKVPVVVLTGLADDGLAMRAVREGAQDYLVKGQIDSNLLIRAIRYAIERYENLEQLRNTRVALALSEERFRNMIEKNVDGILIVDGDGVVRFSNPGAGALWGRKTEELRGQLFGFPAVAGEITEIDIVRRGRETKAAEMRVVEMEWEGKRSCLASVRDITERKKAEEERKKVILQLQNALEKVKTLSGLLPICSFCKKVRDDDGYWRQIESYIEAHSEAEFSHSMCQECARKHYPELYDGKSEEKE